MRDAEARDIADQLRWDGGSRVSFELKTPWRDGTTHLEMTPVDFLERLAALVPRPRLHLIRFHGILAPNAKLRSFVVPRAPASARRAPGCHDRADRDAAAAGTGASGKKATAAPRPGLRWADLLRRVYDIDMRTCPNCGLGTLEPIATILARRHRPHPRRHRPTLPRAAALSPRGRAGLPAPAPRPRPVITAPTRPPPSAAGRRPSRARALHAERDDGDARPEPDFTPRTSRKATIQADMAAPRCETTA